MGLRVVEIFEGDVGPEAPALVRALAALGVTVEVACPPEAVARFADTGAVAVTGVGGVTGVPTLRRMVRPAEPGAPDAEGGRRVDVLHAHGLRAGLSASLARTGSTPLVLSWFHPPRPAAHGVAPGALVGWALARTVVPAAAVVLAATPTLVESATRLGAGDVRLVQPPVLDLPALSRTAEQVYEELALDPRGPLILAEGRLHPESRHEVLIEAAARWRYRLPLPQVVIVGVGPAYRDLVARATVARAPVTFAGERFFTPQAPHAPGAGVSAADPPDEQLPRSPVDDEERASLVDLIRAADVAVVTAETARPFFALAAAQCGLPLVVPAEGQVAHLLGAAAAHVAPGSHEVDALDAAVRHLLDDASARAKLADAALLQSRQWPSVAEVADGLLELYQGLAG